jgi:predicted transcriptional regulator
VKKRRKGEKMSLEKLRSILSLLNLREVSRGSQVHVNTLYRLAAGGEARYSTVKKIVDYLQSRGING